MGFIKRGLLSIRRNKIKTILLFVIIIILSNVIAGAISIREASLNVEKKIKYSMGSATTITHDQQKIRKMHEESKNKKGGFRLEPITEEMIKTIGSSSYVKYYDYSMSYGIGSDKYKKYREKREGEGVVDEENRKKDMSPMENAYKFVLTGVQFNEIISIKEGKEKIKDGRVFTKEEIEQGKEVIVINSKLAEINNLKVGDTMLLTVFGADFSKKTNDGNPVLTKIANYPFKIVGTFDAMQSSEPKKNDQQQDGGFIRHLNEQMNNKIYIPNKVVKAVSDKNFEFFMKTNNKKRTMPAKNQYYYQPVFVLKNTEDLEKFRAEVTSVIPDYYMLYAQTDSFDAISAPLKKSTNLANMVLIVSAVATVFIVALVLLLFLRDRKHEFGIYLSLGEKKGKIVSQILVEVLLIAIVAMSISVFTGNIIAQSLSDKTVTKTEQKDNQMGVQRNYQAMQLNRQLGGSKEVTEDDIIDAYKVKIDISYIIVFYLVGILTVLVAVVVPMLYILRLNPKKIMM